MKEEEKVGMIEGLGKEKGAIVREGKESQKTNVKKVKGVGVERTEETIEESRTRILSRFWKSSLPQGLRMARRDPRQTGADGVRKT